MRSAAKVVGGKVVRICSACSARPAGFDSAGRTSNDADAPPSSAVLGAIHSPPKQPARDVAKPDALLRDVPSPSRAAFGLRIILGMVSVGAVSAATLAFRGAHSGPRLALVMPKAAPAVEEMRPKTELLSLTIEPLELVEPSTEPLAEGVSWVHPVIGTEKPIPEKRTRLFMAERPGERPEECGEGHCGVDLDAPRGTPVVAIREGIVEKVADDSDAKGGRYVWVFHEDIGLRTEYFHFDEIAPDIRAGEPVQAGQWLGSLGSTGIEHSQPHLHFTVRDASQEMRYIDPLPWLEEASILPLLEMRLANSE